VLFQTTGLFRTKYDIVYATSHSTTLRSGCLEVTLVIHLHLAPRLKISGAIPLLCLHGVDRENFTFYVLLIQ
jgi:hypothetical protein